MIFSPRLHHAAASLFALISLLAAGSVAIYLGLRSGSELVYSALGFEKIAPSLFVEKGATTEQVQNAFAIVDASKSLVAQYFGANKATPSIALCRTSGCYASMGGGGTKGKTFDSVLVIVSPLGWSRTIISHELVHAELDVRIGTRKVNSSIPTWFQEGLAVFISKDGRFRKEDCSPALWSKVSRLAGKVQFENQSTLDINASYGVSYAAVNCLVELQGAANFLGRINEVAAGADFKVAFPIDG